MLHRSASSRRRRASRSAASSPQTRFPRSGSTPPAGSPGRRASIAVSASTDQAIGIERSPRNSLVPDVNRSPRHSLIPEVTLTSRDSPRNSIVPDSQIRGSRNNLAPDTYNRSPRNSLVPESALSPRNSLTPDLAGFNRSPRNSLVPESMNRSPRNSLVPDSMNRSPRSSLVPGDVYSSRNSLCPDFNRSPRNSLVPDSGRSPRHSLVPTDTENIMIGASKSPRHSITPETGRSPRTSPRGSITEQTGNRSPRGSITHETAISRSPRSSISHVDRCGKNELTPEINEPSRSPRGSLTFQEPFDRSRRSSADNPSGSRGRSSSPYRMSVRGPQVNLAYSGTAWSEGGSRRASSSVSQPVDNSANGPAALVSGDDQRRLCCESTKLGGDGETGLNLSLGLTLTTYGSVTYQLKDANMEASGTCDFICRALRIVNKTVVVTVVLGCLVALPLLMLIFGIQYLRDCPREPHIPIYMVVGGSFGCVKMACLLWQQLTTRHLDDSVNNSSSVGSRVFSLALNLFLITWFILGNYWILHIKWPDYSPTLFDPNRWCHKTLYVFSLVHLCVMYSVFAVLVVLVVTLAGCQLVGCPWLGPAHYK